MNTKLETKMNTIALLFSMVTLLAFPAFAQSQAPDNRRGDASAEQGPPHEPPARAYANCKDKKEGDKVQIVTPRDEKISGTCTASQKGLFARPDRRPHGDMDANSSPREKK